MSKPLWLAPLAFLLFFQEPLHCATISSFVIVNSSLTTFGGTFAGGGSYYGTFSFDTSQIPGPGSGGSLDLTSVDIFTTAENSGTPVFGTHYTRGQVFKVPSTVLGFAVDLVDFKFLNTVSQLELDFLEVPNTFVGGQVFLAQEVLATSTVPAARKDASGTALAIDPALVPEPAAWSLCLTGAIALVLVKRRCGLLLSGVH